MRLESKLLALIALTVLPLWPSSAATVTGTVKDPSGAPFQGAFVKAQNLKTKMTFIVLSDSRGRYRIEKLPAGDYRVQSKAVGYRTDPPTDLNLTADQGASLDFTLANGIVRWNELSIYQGKTLLPPAKGKDVLFTHCVICHSFQSRMASVTRDEEGWKDRVAYMQDVMHYSIFLGAHLTDQEGSDVASYLASIFGPDSVLPKSAADLPDYKNTVRPFSSDAMNIVYVEFDMPGPSRMPFSAAPDKNGYLWIPNFGVANKITRLDPKTGEMQDYPVPNDRHRRVHSAVPAPDGSVWLTEQGSNKLGRWDRTPKK